LDEAASGFLVHDDSGAGVELQGGGGDHAGNGTFNSLGDDGGLAGAGGEKNASTGFLDSADAHSDSAVRHLVFPAKEGRILLEGGRRERFEIGRASCRESLEISVVAVSLKKNQ